MTTRKSLVEAARGDRELDLLIEDVQFVNVFTLETYHADIGVYGDRIALVLPAGTEELSARAVIDGKGKWAVPGFVDTHVHIESTMVTPANYAAAVLPMGTTTSVIDPHEIGNVTGMAGVRFMIEDSEGLALKVYIAIPSCVPAAPGLETAGAVFGPEEVTEMLGWDRVISVAEVMDFPGVIACTPRMLGIVQAGLDRNLTIQGHAPMVSGRALNAYLAAGNESDHEIRDPDELLEKLRLGMLPLVKDSSFGNPIPALASVLKEHPWAEIALCTDDIEPADLLERGHMDRVLRTMIAAGIRPERAVRFATLNGARHYGLRDHGAIAPGYFADIVLLGSLEDVDVTDVIASGKVVAKDGQYLLSTSEPREFPMENTVRLPELTVESFVLHTPSSDTSMINIIAPRGWIMNLEPVPAHPVDGRIELGSLGDDISLVSIISRHGQNRPPTLVPLKGFPLARGAMASTISHDSHNMAVVGKNPADMFLAAKTLEECGGGVALVVDGQVLAKVKLPIAGLLSPLPVPELAEEVRAFNKAAWEAGITSPVPVLTLAGFALPCRPEGCVVTDLGIVNVATQQPLSLFP